jgi:hypothetical protein
VLQTQGGLFGMGMARRRASRMAADQDVRSRDGISRARWTLGEINGTLHGGVGSEAATRALSVSRLSFFPG